MALRFLKASLGAALVLGAQVALAQQPAPAGDAELAHRHKTAMCIGCHGIPGYRTAFPPKRLPVCMNPLVEGSWGFG